MSVILFNMKKFYINQIVSLLVLSLFIGCSSTQKTPEKNNYRKKTVGWISDEQFIVKAEGISDGIINSNLKTDINYIDAKKSALFNAQQKMLEKFKRISNNHNSVKQISGKKIVALIKQGIIIRVSLIDNKRCLIHYSLNKKNLKKMVEKANLNEILIIN